MIGSGEVTGGGRREISHIRGATVRRSGGKETSPCSVRNDWVGVGGGVRRGSGNANVAICEESDWLVGAGGRAAMIKKKLLLVGLVCALGAGLAVGVRGEATEIDAKKLEELKAQVAKRKLGNVVVVESKEADTNLPAGCRDAIFLRHVYHHLTKPAEFDASLVRSLKPGGRLAIIDFPARAGLDPVEGVPSNRGGHGIPQKIVIEELSAAGLQVEKIVNDWPENDYCVLFVKK